VNKRRAEKIARDISKNKAIKIPAHHVPSFKPSKEFVKQIKDSKKLKA
jgi:DNA-binding protein HU-beta